MQTSINTSTSPTSTNGEAAVEGNEVHKLKKIGPPREKCGVELGRIVVATTNGNCGTSALAPTPPPIAPPAPAMKASNALSSHFMQQENGKLKPVERDQRDSLLEAIRNAGGIRSLRKSNMPS
jgi:hypothetical protein